MVLDGGDSMIPAAGVVASVRSEAFRMVVSLLRTADEHVDGCEHANGDCGIRVMDLRRAAGILAMGAPAAERGELEEMIHGGRHEG